MLNKLPDCQLLGFLREKSDARSDVEFDYITQLAEFRHRVAGEVRFINQLFPEYTPHDDEYHLSRLFHVADTLIGAERYALLNATELFVLACGLYGHDWGMAVSEAERGYIVSKIAPDGFAASDFALLPDEHQRFERFAKDNGLNLEAIRESGISNEDWREYVRATHAYRSGERLRRFFREIDPGVAEAAGRVCEGHWLNIEDIQNFTRYPTNFAVLRENLNLAAIAVYVRLLDLLDIGHDRTPYVIWKFVAPRDSRSKMEWNKHRALQPITCPPYLNGRLILVDGSTSDHEVYAALEDLHKYCEAQIRECTDLLARLPDSRSLLDIYHLEWRVAALGFDPVLIQFEFDRDSVLQILSDEIYQGDPYVFLRELLQNSIDAIRMRRELLERLGGIKVEHFGLIRVEVEHKPNGNCTVTWTDDGVGMDTYIVRNYLAVAGRSYYRSEEFERQGLSLDPISKFGVGILSCFMVANLLEIETRRDPYASSSSEALRIRIPAINRQFRIERNPSIDFSVGTRVTVHVDGRRLDEKSSPLNVTQYLKLIAGFVEFPIVVCERDRKTTILSPASGVDVSTDARLINERYNDRFSIDLAYPLAQAVLPQDLETAQTTLTAIAFDLRNDLNLHGYEGNISFLTPINSDIPVSRVGFGERGLSFLNSNRPVRWRDEWSSYWSSEVTAIAKSANTPVNRAIHRNGILVPNAQLPDESHKSSEFPFPRIVINIVSQNAAELDIARVQLSNSHWFKSIQQALELRLLRRLEDELHGRSLTDSFVRLGLFFSVFHLGSDFLRKIGFTGLPVALITSNGGFGVNTWNQWANRRVKIFPKVLDHQARRLIEDAYNNRSYDLLSEWQGEEAVISKFDYEACRDVRLQRALELTQHILDEFYVPTGVMLLHPPLATLKPLVQEIWEPLISQSDDNLYSIASKAVQDPAALSAQQRHRLLKEWNRYFRYIFVPFPQASPLAAGNVYNLSNPIGELLFRSIAWLLTKRLANEEDDANSGNLEDALDRILYRSRRPGNLEAALPPLFSAIRNVGVVVNNLTSTPADYEIWHDSGVLITKKDQTFQAFGYPLNT